MGAPVNTLKARLLAGERCHGCWLGLADAYSAELAGTAGFDWLLIDGEHAPNDIRSILAQLRAVQAGPSAPVVRLPDGDPVKIKQVLDIGAQTLLIPIVESAEQAEMLVRATRYPPRGTRGVGAALARASSFGKESDYLATADAQVCLILQVENRAGLAALDDILKVEGVDGVFIGPADLAADLGLAGPADPEARKVVMEALSRIAASGKFAGVLGFQRDFIDAAAEAGATFLGVGADITILREALTARAQEFRSGG
ncbi:MAG: HpcH/HpaI aldolase/citrate lyase family protein [Pseudomonadota bacterium]